MDPTRIRELLDPFLTISVPRVPRPSRGFCERAGDASDQQPPATGVLSVPQLQNISTYIDLLVRWNARINLTAVRQPEEIVTRHFGESLFAARHLFPLHVDGVTGVLARPLAPTTDDLLDIGSGAGFPGLPIKIWAPQLRLTLIESNHKKATFLHEVVRTLALTDVNVFAGRAEDYSAPADVVTLRAVERFEMILPVAAHLVAPGGRLALLIGHAQVHSARDLVPNSLWAEPVPVPHSDHRTLLIGTHQRFDPI